MRQFEKVSRFADVDLVMPTRSTEFSAGYDLCVAEDIIVPPLEMIVDKVRDYGMSNSRHEDYYGFLKPFTLDEVEKITKELEARPTLVTTGMKCKLDKDEYLEICARSSFPQKHLMIVANAEAIIDADYYGNESNEGEIFVQVLNLLPFAVQLKQGDRIAQGIVKKYYTLDNDEAKGERTGGIGSTSLPDPIEEIKKSMMEQSPIYNVLYGKQAL